MPVNFRFVQVLLTILIAVVAFGAGPTAFAKSDPPILGSPRAKKGGVFRYNLGAPPSTLNPLTASDNYSANARQWLFESLLTRHEETYDWVPLLAEKYAISPDNTTFTFELRKGVRFHNGAEMSAEDVKFSFDVYRMDLYKTMVQEMTLKHLDAVEVLGPHTVRIRMKTPYFSNFQTIVGVPIVPKGVYGDKKNVSRMNKTAVGTGPYRLKDYKVNRHLNLERNPEWWGRNLPEYRYKYNFNEISVRFPMDDTVLLQMLEAGELDYSGLGLDVFLQKTKGKAWGQKVFAEVERRRGLYTTQQGVFWNLRKPIFSSRKTRKALQLLLNRELMNEKIRGGRSLMAAGPWHCLSEYADPAVQPTTFNPKEALRLLREDGWADRDGDGVLEKTDQGQTIRFEFTLLYPKPTWDKYLTIFQADAKAAGIRIHLQLTEWTLFLKRLTEFNYDAYLVGRGWPNVVDFDPKLEWHSQEADKDNNIAYKNTAVDPFLEQVQVEMDRGKRIRLLRQAYRLIAEDHSHLSLFCDRDGYFARSARVKWEKPSYTYLLGMDYWWLEE